MLRGRLLPALAAGVLVVLVAVARPVGARALESSRASRAQYGRVDRYLDGLDGRRLGVRDGRLVDALGREIILRGVNARVKGIFDVSFDDGRLPLDQIPSFGPADADRMRALGFDLLRLPISWSALEPRRGHFDSAYLDRIARVVRLCGSRGILVLLDFHQDGFSKEIGQDGAPRWVLDRLLGPNGYPVLGGPLRHLRLRQMAPWTLLAFRRFFDDRDHIQSDYAAAAVRVARRFRESPDVLGYDLMNEPLAFLSTWRASARPDPLLSFTLRVAAAIRRVDPDHFIAFEPDVLRNTLNRAPLAARPFPLRRALYAPHIYTGVMDGWTYGGDARELAPSMQHAAREAASWGVPLLIGEYGIGPTQRAAKAWLRQELDLQDQLRASSAFWLWKEIGGGRWGLFQQVATGMPRERRGLADVLSRVYARAVPGRVLEHSFDAKTGRLRLRYRARVAADVELFVPAERYPDGFVLSCDGRRVQADWNRTSGTLSFACGRVGREHRVDLIPVPPGRWEGPLEANRPEPGRTFDGSAVAG